MVVKCDLLAMGFSFSFIVKVRAVVIGQHLQNVDDFIAAAVKVYDFSSEPFRKHRKLAFYVKHPDEVPAYCPVLNDFFNNVDLPEPFFPTARKS